MLRDTGAAFGLRVEHAQLGPHMLIGYGSITSAQWIPYMACVTQHLLTFGEQVTKIWTTNLHCPDAQSLVEVKRPLECLEEWIAELVWSNLLSVPTMKNNVTPILCHVCRFICNLCVEFKLQLNTRSLSNQALNPVHPLLFNSHCWPWGVFSSWLGSGDLGRAHSSYLARVRPMVNSELVRGLEVRHVVLHVPWLSGEKVVFFCECLASDFRSRRCHHVRILRP